ncbi:beta-lactamase family protein [Alteromonas sediminis]|uniref:beta-lactamase family protein n=1 Tax=Alteromonas sediminis TaxID=2259342 RepID=UPI001F0BB18B|nr:beta-lactamase family protein [Alteromonas sediminis]
MSSYAVTEHPLEKVLLEDGSLVSYQSLLEEHKLTGLSFVVVDDYQVVFQKQLGEKAFGSEEYIDENTAFSTASITKGIVGTLAVMLAAKGKLDLDAPVSNYLKRWSLPTSPYTATTPITLRHLLSHTAGTTQHGFADFYQGDDIPTLIESLNGQLPRYDKPISVTFTPGSNWSYSGGGYVIAQVAIEDLMGQSLAELAASMLFEPLGMKHTTFYQHGDEGFLTNVAKVHDHTQSVIKTGIPICPQIAPSGMWSTPSDMAKFVIEMQRALAGEKTKVISQAVAEKVTMLETLEGVGGWSLGWMRYEGYGNVEWFSHGGSNTGTGGHVMGTMKGGKGIMIFGNGPNPSRIPVINKVRDSVIAQMGWSAQIEGQEKAFSSSQIKALTGRYLAPFNDVVEIRFKDKGLQMISRFFSAEMYPLKQGKFAMDDFINHFSLQMNPADGKQYITYTREGTELLSYAMLKLDKDQKLPAEVAKGDNVEETYAAYKQWKTSHPQSHLLSARTINQEGYNALNEGEVDTAITLFTVYTKLYPEDGNAFDSLAEAYKEKGNVELAIENYQRSIALNPENEHAKNILETLTKR